MIDTITIVADDRDICIDEIEGRNILVQCVQPADVQIILNAVYIALTNKAIPCCAVKRASVSMVDGRIYMGPNSGRNILEIPSEDLEIMLGNPFNLIRRLETDMIWKEGLGRTIFELSRGRILSIRFENNFGYYVDYQKGESRSITDLPIDEKERVRLAIMVAAIMKQSFPFIVLSCRNAYGHDFNKRVFDVIIRSQKTQILVVLDVVGSYMVFPDTKAATEGWISVMVE